MSRAADLSAKEVAKRQLERESEEAAQRLIRRAKWMKQRAMRAARGSNERRKLLARARHLEACAVALAAEHDFQLALRGDGYLHRGWRELAYRVTDLYRKREAGKRVKRSS